MLHHCLPFSALTHTPPLLSQTARREFNSARVQVSTRMATVKIKTNTRKTIGRGTFMRTDRGISVRVGRGTAVRVG